MIKNKMESEGGAASISIKSNINQENSTVALEGVLTESLMAIKQWQIQRRVVPSLQM